MMLFALDQCIGITDGRTNIIDRDAVFALDLIEAHSSRQTSEDNRDRQSGAADYRLAVADLRVNYDAVIFVHVPLIIPPRTRT